MGAGPLLSYRRYEGVCERIPYDGIDLEPKGGAHAHISSTCTNTNKGMATSQYSASGPGAGGPPPPPPPPPPPAGILPSGAPATPPAGGAGAVFAELNKGEAVTQGLRKVDKSEMTHKNPSLRASSVVPDRAPSSRKFSVG